MSDLDFIPDEPVPPARPGRFPWIPLVAVALIVAALVAILAPAIRASREAANASQCLCNLCQIRLGLSNYHEFYGCFPPAYVADANGKPMHSWRVLILPQLDSQSATLYQSYNMAEPWDSPNNRKLLERRPNIFNCPSRIGGPSLTSYVAVTGPGTVFPGPGTTKLGDIHDGPDRTILVAEVSNVDIAWTEPRDLDVRSMSWFIDDPKKPGISSPHPGGPAIIFADTSYRRLTTYHPPEQLKAMTTIDGHEPGH